MLWRAANASDQMTNPVKIESALYFPINHVAHESGFASSLGRSTTL
jgi:hypothetical protein